MGRSYARWRTRHPAARPQLCGARSFGAARGSTDGSREARTILVRPREPPAESSIIRRPSLHEPATAMGGRSCLACGHAMSRRRGRAMLSWLLFVAVNPRSILPCRSWKPLLAWLRGRENTRMGSLFCMAGDVGPASCWTACGASRARTIRTRWMQRFPPGNNAAGE